MRKRTLNRTFMYVLASVMILSFFFISTSIAQEYTKKDLNEQLVMGTLWYQRSAEMRAISYQAFNLAKLIFDMDLKRGSSGKKRAVVVDIDETVLDNSPYEAGIVGKDTGYPKGWGEWCNAAKADALPGSVDFLKYVASKGADVFYISNRKVKYKEGTMKNMQALGFPQVDDVHMLLREKTSDKEPRRQLAQKDHRIVLMMGDNLNDFDSIFRKKGIEDRLSAVDQVKDKFGTRFIVLPNPMYGEWEGAVYNFNWKLSSKEKSDARKASLIPWP